MPPVRPLTATTQSHLQVMLTDDGSSTLSDTKLGETYHSGCGALSESWEVYVRNSGIANLLDGNAERNTVRPVRVLEYGFGTGMSWLLTAAWAAAHSKPLTYVALEHCLLAPKILAQLNLGDAIEQAIAKQALPPELQKARQLESQWLSFRSQLRDPVEESSFEFTASSANGSAHSVLQIEYGDAALYPRRPTEAFDAIYFDAFSPSTSPGLWTEDVFRRAASVLVPGGRLVSYCVSGMVRRALGQAGFDVTRVPGPVGGKREVLVAFKRGDEVEQAQSEIQSNEAT